MQTIDQQQALRFSKTHEWVRKENDGTVTVGISDHAQQLLGELVFVQLPELLETVHQRAEIGVVESVKAASDLYAPLTGEVVAVNAQLEQQPGLVNQAPFNAGWIFRLKPADPSEFDQLLTGSQYQQLIADAGD